MTQGPLYNWPRKFQIWSYKPTHSQLLLRSNKWNQYPTRIEVLFKGVSQMHVADWVEGLTISVAEDNAGLPSAAIAHGRRVYRIEAPEFQGYVAALAIFVHEDELGYNEPSSFLNHHFL